MSETAQKHPLPPAAPKPPKDPKFRPLADEPPASTKTPTGPPDTK